MTEKSVSFIYEKATDDIELKRFSEMRAAYARGFRIGTDIGLENRSEFEDYDTYMDECTMHESDHFRQFSPFEFYAKEYNESVDPDATWAAYEQGVRRGLERAWGDDS